MDDIHIEAELDFCLSPSDPQYNPTFEHNDNRVASRTLHSPESPDVLNFGIDEPSSVVGPQSWLFHDLTEHGYGKDQPAVALEDLLRIDDIQVEIIIRYDTILNLI